MFRIEPRIQKYAWGSHEQIARLTGRERPTEEPEAELWFGAHDAAPSVIVDADAHARPLTEAIADDPVGLLGEVTASRFGDRLPFLLKVLAPVQALSIQAHPSEAQVGEAPEGTYADAWPKPEAFLALTEFHTFAGTRSFAEVKALCERLAIDTMQRHLDAVANDPDPLRALLIRLLHMDQDQQKKLADAVAHACRQETGDAHCAAVAATAEHYPGDVGLAVLLAMHYRVFEPGEYAYLPAGVLHAYVRGVAVEIMANSDNVVRAGLTAKRIDVEELLRIVDFETPVSISRGKEDAGWVVYPAENDYFQLRSSSLSKSGVAVPADGAPRVLMVLEGEAHVSRGDAVVELASGQGCFLGAGDDGVTVRGTGTVYLASSPAS